MSTTAINTSALGIFGGTFDPIHNGHIASVIATAQHINIQQVLLLPAHIPPHKSSVIASSEHRLAMANMVCQHHPLFTCDDRELKRTQPSYTIDTLKEIKSHYPNRPLYFFMGMDSLLSFTTWHCWQDILSYCHLVVTSRPNYSTAKLNQATAQLLATHQSNNLDEIQRASAGKIYLYQQPDFAISSTEIRHQLLQKDNRLTDLPPYILRYINQHHLYQTK